MAYSFIIAFILGGIVSSGSAEVAQVVNRSVVSGNARFQVLSPMLVRMEYSPGGKFADEPTASVINRDDWPAASFRSEVTDGWQSVSTDKLTLRYHVGSGPNGTVS
jgi:hypothetical protein